MVPKSQILLIISVLVVKMQLFIDFTAKLPAFSVLVAIVTPLVFRLVIACRPSVVAA